MKPLQRAAVLAATAAAALAFFAHTHAAASTRAFGVYVNVTTSATAAP